MWWDGAPHQGQCEGCTLNAWHMEADAVYLNARGVSFAMLTVGRVGRGGALRRVHGLPPALVLRARRHRADRRPMGTIVCFLRDGDRVFLTYSTTGRGNEPADGPWVCST